MTKLSRTQLWALLTRRAGVFLIPASLLLSGCNDSRPSDPSPDAAGTERIAYRPDLCSIDPEAMVYFALGREVYRKPYDEPMNIRSMPDARFYAIPPAPSPSEPEGCPGNPIRGTSFSFSYEHVPEHPENYPEGTSFRADSLQLIALREDFKGTPVAFGLQPSLERLFERTRDLYQRCESLINKLTACYIPLQGFGRQNWDIQLQASPDDYPMPYGRPFTVSCGTVPQLARENTFRQNCQVSYNYSEDARIHYKFEIHNIPPEEVLKYDKGVRRRVESMRVESYRWAE